MKPGDRVQLYDALATNLVPNDKGKRRPYEGAGVATFATLFGTVAAVADGYADVELDVGGRVLRALAQLREAVVA